MIVTQTPLRVSLAGGGTDFPEFYERHGGCVVSSAIDKYVYCIVKERFDDKIYVNYSKKEIVDSVDDLEHGLVREAMRVVGIERGVEISFMADVPAEGTGLGSSSSVTVGVLNALYHLIGETPTQEQLARKACEIEIGRLGKPIGVQDQYIAAYGGLRCFRFGPGPGVFVQKVRISRAALEDLDNSLVLYFTGITRRADNILVEQKSSIGDCIETLQELTGLADETKRVLEEGNTQGLGEILHRGWIRKTSLARGVTDGNLNGLYERAIRAGAIGGKLSGAGGGGFFLLYVPTERRQAVRNALDGLREMPFHFERTGSRVVVNMQRY